MSPRWQPKAAAFWPTLVAIYCIDFVTKRIAESHLFPEHVPHPVLGDFVRLTLAYNSGAAMGLSLGGYSRIGFTLTAAVILAVLGTIYHKSPARAKGPAFALALIAAGALGNLTDRLMTSKGVVDFIDIGIGSSRFYTFNVADSAITCGAILLAVLSMKKNREET
ncbi:MAG: signal peptidase II [Gemmatimonadales bacterium]